MALGLTACAGSSGRSSAEAAAAEQNAKIYRRQRSEALELVDCAHRHGIPLPQPDPKTNGVSTVGINLKSHRRKEALSNCYHGVVRKAERVQAAERQAIEAERRRRGEPPLRETQSAQAGAAFAQEREHLMEVVRCARRHGIHLPEPDSHNNINTRKVNIKTPHNKNVMNHCFQEVVSKVSREQQEAARERESGPRRLGE